MKKKTNQEVYIPQLNLRRKLYTENDKQYIRLKDCWEELNELKANMKNQFSMNIEFKIY